MAGVVTGLNMVHTEAEYPGPQARQPEAGQPRAGQASTGPPQRGHGNPGVSPDRPERFGPTPVPGTGAGVGPGPAGAGRAHRRRRRDVRRPWYVREAALTAVLGVVTAGLVAVSQDYWRRGLFVVGASLIGAGLLRLLLPTRAVGLLAVRSRLFDVLMLVALGAGVIGLTLLVPAPTAS